MHKTCNIFISISFSLIGSNLEISFDVTNSNKQEPRKSTISGRKPTAAKKGVSLCAFAYIHIISRNLF